MTSSLACFTQQNSRLEERVSQLSDSLASLRAEHAALRTALCADAPTWAEHFCDRRTHA